MKYTWVDKIFHESEVAVYKNTPPQVSQPKYEVEVHLICRRRKKHRCI